MKLNKLFLASAGIFGLSLALSGCSGGAGSGPNLASQVSNKVAPSGTMDVNAGQDITVASSARAYFDVLSSQVWTIAQVSGETSTSVPQILDANCASATTSPGKAPLNGAPGYDGTGVCETHVVIPQGITTGKWVLTNTAKSAGGGMAADKLTLNVTAAPAADFTLNIPSVPLSATVAGTASVRASYSLSSSAILGSAGVTYQWSQVSGTAVAIAGAATSTMAFVPNDAGTYVFQVQASANINNQAKVLKGAVVVIASATPSLSVNAGPLQVAPTSAPVTLTGTESGTVDATKVSYQWTQVSGPAVSLFNETSLTPNFLPTTAGMYVFQLTGNYGGAQSVTASAQTGVSVIVPTATTYFAASAGPAQIVTPNKVTTLTGQVAVSNPAPKNLTYNWKQTGGASVAISAANSLVASFIPSAEGTYDFLFTVSDGTTTKTDATSVVVSSAPATTFTVAAGALQSAAINTTVNLQGTVGGNTPAASLTYKWTQASGPAASTLYGSDTLNAQLIPSAAGNYEFDLAVTLPGTTPVVHTARTLVVVYSTAASPVTPSFGVSAGNAQIVGPSPITVTLQGAVVNGLPAPAPASLVYSWKQTAGPAVSSLSNANTLTASFVADATGLYTFELTVTASGVSQTSSTSVEVLAVKP